MPHPALAKQFIVNRDRAQWHDKALWFVREKRDRMAAAVPEWELLRETASAIKSHTQSRLAEYLEQFEANAKKLGVYVHWGDCCRRTQSDRARYSAASQGAATGEEQVDAHRGVPPQSLP